MRAHRFLLAVALAGLAGASETSARAAFLSDLLVPGATLNSGEFTFSNFTYQPPTGPPPATAVTVTPFTDGAGLVGIQIGGGFLSTGAPPTDVRIGYTVTDTLGARITDVHMDGNPTSTPASSVVGALVTESVFSGGVLLATGQISSVSPPGSQSTSIVLPGGPFTTLDVTKDILLAGSTNPNFAASVSFIDQTFSVTPVPEPASFVMMGLGVGLGGLLVRVRRVGRGE